MTATSLARLFVSDRDQNAAVAVRGGRHIPFGQFASDAGHAAATMRAAGVARGAVVSNDPYRFLVGMFGLLHAGATVVVPPDALPSTLASLSNRFDVLLSDDTPLAPPARPIGIRETETGKAETRNTAAGRGAAPPDAIDPATAMLEFFTSGSTGAAKCIRKPLALLEREIATLETRFGHAIGEGPVFATVPHRHIFGLTFHLLWPLATGRPFASHVDELWEDLLARDPANAVLVTSPAHLTRLGGIAPLSRGQRPAAIFTAGAPLSAAQSRQAAAILGAVPIEIFGSTETGAVATRRQPVTAEPWQPLPDIAVHAGGDGHMVVESPYGLEDGPFFSADRIEQLPHGRFHFLGRADRIAKIEGKRVSLARIEQELEGLEGVDEAAVVAIGDSPERLAAAVVVSAAGQPHLSALGPFRFSRELRRLLSPRLEQAALPKSWRFVDALPRGAMGKRRDADIRALFGSRRDSA